MQRSTTRQAHRRVIAYEDRREKLKAEQEAARARRLESKAPPKPAPRAVQRPGWKPNQPPAAPVARSDRWTSATGKRAWSHMPVRARLLEQTEARGGCIEWIGSRSVDGYGRAVIMGRRWNTHRLSWVLHRGPIPDGLVVRHACDNPACVRIEHLRLGTQRDNIRDRDRKGRGKVPIRAGNGWTGKVMHSSRRRRRADRPE